MKRNFIYNVCYQILSLIIPIITTPYLSRILGVDGVGIFSYVNSIVNIFIIFCVLGTATYGQRLIAYNRDDRKKLSSAFANVFVLRVLTTFFVLSVYLFFAFSQIYNKYLYLLMTFSILNVIFDITWFYQGLEDFKRIVIRNSFVKMLNLISIFIFVKTKKDLSVYVAIYCGFTVLGNLTTWIGIRKFIDFTKDVHPFSDIKNVLLLFLPTVAMQIYTILDKSMIGWITKSTYENGCYEQAEKICRIATTVVAAIAIVIAPRISNLYKKYKDGLSNRESIMNLSYKGASIACLFAFPIMFGIIGITPIFVPVFFGPGYDKVEILMPIFSLLVLEVGLANVIGIAYLIPTGQQNTYTKAITISAIVNLCMNLFLIYKFGAVGAAISSVVAEGVGIIYQIVFCVRKNRYDIAYVANKVWKYLISSLIMLIVIVIIRNWMLNNMFSLFNLILVGAFTYFVLLLVTRDQLFVETTHRLLVSVHKKD